MRWVFFGVMMAILWSMVFSQWGPKNKRRRGLDAEAVRRLDELEQELLHRDDTIALLEARVSELENRLDFTERLLARPGGER
jgi:hypothetical protein